MELALPRNTTPEPPLFRSRFGGCWVDRTDAVGLLARKLAAGEVTTEEAEQLRHFIDKGYVVFKGAVAPDAIDEYVAFFEGMFTQAPPTIFAHAGGKVLPLSRALFDRVAKVSDVHAYFPRASELIYPPAVLRFLSLVYERPPVVFQTMSMRKGSEEPLHTDTGPLTLTEPLTLTAAWVALEDVRAGSGEFQFVPGSHALPEVLHHGTTKGHGGDFIEYGAVLAKILKLCKERGLPTEYFHAKKGDVLIWHADLMHGGAPIADPTLTRKSLVSHFMPLGVMPTFYDFSQVKCLRYPNGGYCLDRFAVASPAPTERSAAETKGLRGKIVDRVTGRVRPLVGEVMRAYRERRG